MAEEKKGVPQIYYQKSDSIVASVLLKSSARTMSCCKAMLDIGRWKRVDGPTAPIAARREMCDFVGKGEQLRENFLWDMIHPQVIPE